MQHFHGCRSMISRMSLDAMNLHCARSNREGYYGWRGLHRLSMQYLRCRTQSALHCAMHRSPVPCRIRVFPGEE